MTASSATTFVVYNREQSVWEKWEGEQERPIESDFVSKGILGKIGKQAAATIGKLAESGAAITCKKYIQYNQKHKERKKAASPRFLQRYSQNHISPGWLARLLLLLEKLVGEILFLSPA